MARKSFFAIGHVTNDLEPSPHPGGGVSYSALAATRLGYSSTIITQLPSNHPYIFTLNGFGIDVWRLFPKDMRYERFITSFRNFYDREGRRRQIVTKKQEDINSMDLNYFPPIPENSVILVAPVIAEVSEDLFPYLSHKGKLVVTPQGYFRKIEEDGVVKRVPWLKVDSLRFAKAVILSDEDLTFDGERGMDEQYLQRVREYCPLVVLTKGKEGATIFEKDKEPISIKSFPLKEDELRDLTGAGDSYAASFTIRYDQTKDAKDAGIFAALYSGIKIVGREGGIGLSSIPRLETVRSFISDNIDRFNLFLKENGRNSLLLSSEGNNHTKERL